MTDDTMELVIIGVVVWLAYGYLKPSTPINALTFTGPIPPGTTYTNSNLGSGCYQNDAQGNPFQVGCP